MAVSISNLSTTFANSSFTYNAISMNVTTGLYGANSKLLTLKANGDIKFSVDVNGHTIAAGINLVPTLVVSYEKANNALANSTGTFQGNLTISDRAAINTSISSAYRFISNGTMALLSGGYRIHSDGNNQNTWRDLNDTVTRMQLGYNATAIQGIINVVNTTAPLIISTSGTERMRITNTGNVLIARTADSTVDAGVKLDIGAGVNAASYLVNGVPLGMELITTLSATGVATQSPSGLTLTGYRLLVFDFNGISSDTNNRAATINGQVFGAVRSSSELVYGLVFVSLTSGRAWGVIETDGNPNSTLRNLSLTNANTTFTVGWNGSGNFDAGSITVYGVR